ncbi:MAG: type II toxin-antitoxin system RelE/ParE family toxin [Gemmatimonadaceae bacterium]
MEVEFDDDDLDRLETDPQFTAKWAREIVRGFRKVVQSIRSASDERDLFASRGLHFERMKGNRSHQHSLRINKQWRLIVEIRGTAPSKRIGVVGIEDYH